MSIRLNLKSHPFSNSISSFQKWKKGSGRKERNSLIWLPSIQLWKLLLTFCQASHAFSDMINPTKNPNLRTQPTWLRSRLYRLVEPLTIKPIGTTQLPIIIKNAPLRLLKFLTCSSVHCQITLYQDSVKDGDVVCVLSECLLALPLVPVPADVRNGNITEQKGDMYDLFEQTQITKNLTCQRTMKRFSSWTCASCKINQLQ